MADDRAAVAALLDWTPTVGDDVMPFPDRGGWTRHMRSDGENEYPTTDEARR